MKKININNQSYDVNSLFTQINGTSFKGYVETTYDHIVDILGDPLEGGDKTTAEWVVRDSGGAVATIYDWKTESTPFSLYKWHIGGYTFEALNIVEDVLGVPVMQN